MQTTPLSVRISEPTQFSATFENQGSGTIYNTKYMLAIGKKLRMWYCFTMENPLPTKSNISPTASITHNALKCSLLCISHKVMIWLLLWNADNSTFSEKFSTNAVFCYLWKPRFWHHLQHEVHVSYREESQNVILLHYGKPGSNQIKHFSHSVYKTQCAEMQLIEYSAQSNDLAAPLKCRQLHVQRELQNQRSFQLTLKTKVLALFTTRSAC